MESTDRDLLAGIELVAETIETSANNTDTKLDKIRETLNKLQPIISYSDTRTVPAVNKPAEQPTPIQEQPGASSTPDQQPTPASNPTKPKTKIVREKGNVNSFRAEALNFVKTTFHTMSGAVTNQIDKLGEEIVPGYGAIKDVSTKVVSGAGTLAKSAFERMRGGNEEPADPKDRAKKILPSSRTDKAANEPKKQTKLLLSIDKSLKRPQKGTKVSASSSSLGDMARMFLPMTMLIGTMVSGVIGIMSFMASGVTGLITTMAAGITGLITTMTAGIAKTLEKLTNPFKKAPLPSSTKNPTKPKGSSDPSSTKGKDGTKPKSTSEPNKGTKPSARQPSSVTTNTSKLERISTVTNTSSKVAQTTAVEAAEATTAKQAGKFGLGTAVKTGAKRVAGAGMNAGAAALGMGSKAIPVVGQIVMLAQSIDMLVEAITGKAWLSKENLDTVGKAQNGGMERAKEGQKTLTKADMEGAFLGSTVEMADTENNRIKLADRKERATDALRAMANQQNVNANTNVSNSTNNTFVGNAAMSQRSAAERRGSTYF